MSKRRRLSSSNEAAAESNTPNSTLNVRTYEPKPSSSSKPASSNPASLGRAAIPAAAPAKPMSAIEVRRAKRLAQEEKAQQEKAEKKSVSSGALLVKPFQPPPQLAAESKSSKASSASKVSDSESVSDSSADVQEPAAEATDSGSALPDSLFELNQPPLQKDEIKVNGKQKKEERKGPQRYFSGEASGGHVTEQSDSEEALAATPPLQLAPEPAQKHAQDGLEQLNTTTTISSSTATFIPQPGRNATRVHFRSPQHASAYAYASINADTEGILLALKSTDAVAVTGTATLRVLSGSVLFQQALFSPSSGPIDIIAPSTHVLPRLEVAPVHKTDDGRLNKLYKAAKLSPAVEDPSFDDFSAVVLLLPSAGSGIRGIDQVARLAGIISRSSSLWSAPATDTLLAGTTFAVLGDAAEGRACGPLAADWEVALERVEHAVADGNKSLTLTALGPKRSGKSTLCRYAVNRLMQSYVPNSDSLPERAADMRSQTS